MPEEEKREARRVDPEAVAKELELELILKRASWQKAQAQRGTWRMMSILFLLLIIIGAMLAYFYFVPQLREREEGKTPASETSR